MIEQLKKAHYENRLPDRLKILGKYKLLVIDETRYLPMDIQGANLFFQLIARRYEKASTIYFQDGKAITPDSIFLILHKPKVKPGPKVNKYPSKKLKRYLLPEDFDFESFVDAALEQAFALR